MEEALDFYRYTFPIKEHLVPPSFRPFQSSADQAVSCLRMGIGGRPGTVDYSSLSCDRRRLTRGPRCPFDYTLVAHTYSP